MALVKILKSDIINRLINAHDYKSYLEIGVRKGINFDSIHCDRKVGVDPDPLVDVDFRMTSDQFFNQNKELFDIILIDGEHTFAQAYKDILNSLEYISPGGCIVIHDTNPELEIYQRVPRESKVWNGDVWKAISYFRNRFEDVYICTVDTDYGVTIIKDGGTAIDSLSYYCDNWEDFQVNKEEILNLITVDEFYTIY